MKQVRLIALVLALLMFGALSFVSADDSDNACEGGLLDGRCNSDWTWICGYYLEHWEAAGGWNSSYQFPDWCDPASLLPPKPETTTNLAGCYAYNVGRSMQPLRAPGSVYYNGVSGSSYTNFASADCSGSGSTYAKNLIVEASDESTALAICSTLVNPAWAAVNSLNSRGYLSASPTLWFCYED